MGIVGSPDIFQAKMSVLMVALKFVKTYLDDVLCITRASLDDHLDKLREVPTRLRGAGLKVTARKSKFCTKETEYLGYVLTTMGIKTQPKKVQAILAQTPWTGVKDLCRFLGMVQYYQVWAKRSEMLAPLTLLVGQCGHTKITRACKTRKVPWHWDEVHQNAFDAVKEVIANDVALDYPDYS